MLQLALSFSIRVPSPYRMTRLVSEHDQPHIRSPLKTAAPTSRLRRRGMRRTKRFLSSAFQAMGYRGSSTRISQDYQVLEDLRISSVERLSSGMVGFHDSSLDDDADGDIFP